MRTSLVKSSDPYNGYLKSKLKINYQLHFLLLPSVVLILMFSYAPILGLIMAFQDFKVSKGFLGSPFVGLKYFDILFSTPDFYQIIRNTFFFASTEIIFLLLFSFIFALLLNEVRATFFKRFVQTFVYLPHFLSWVILSGIFIEILNVDGGLVNQFLVNLFGMKPIFFLGDGNWFRFTIVTTDVWKEFGYSAIVILAAISSIDPSLYEAAEMDGANRWQQTLFVTIPSLIPIMIVVATLKLGSVLDANFDQIFPLYNGLVMEKADIIDTYAYRMGLLNLNFSFTAAVGMFKSVVSFVMIVIGYRLAYKLANYRIF
ncbi:ABC transporter permease [Cohnella silvisoli]|uniref:ABC transporter permease subunit n=1 Tax=Cohnella silvisoli TaxID=2873699 RepID=A0ABV1KQK6_9BACL|nr:ABC transporter permease subunit [Cohnella silvisoli]MCD9024649.1 ABC transporter permease subunit [Cohnella silvisoli]